MAQGCTLFMLKEYWTTSVTFLRKNENPLVDLALATEEFSSTQSRMSLFSYVVIPCDPN